MRSDALNPQDALVAVMIATSAADDTMTIPELHEITAIVGVLPVFEGYDTDRIAEMGRWSRTFSSEEDGLDALLGLIEGALPGHLRERPMRWPATLPPQTCASL